MFDTVNHLFGEAEPILSCLYTTREKLVTLECLWRDEEHQSGHSRQYSLFICAVNIEKSYQSKVTVVCGVRVWEPGVSLECPCTLT